LIALEEAGTADLTDVVPALIKVTHDPNISVRSSAVMLLGQYGTRSNQGA
jgi:HEAT repeat protein